MRIAAIALAALASAAGVALAQDRYYYYDPSNPDDPAWVAREQSRDAWVENRRYDDARWHDQRWRGYAQRGDYECWNPHAGHFERVRPGEYQDDLNFSRCRPLGGVMPYPGYYGR